PWHVHLLSAVGVASAGPARCTAHGLHFARRRRSTRYGDRRRAPPLPSRHTSFRSRAPPSVVPFVLKRSSREPCDGCADSKGDAAESRAPDLASPLMRA